MQISSALCRERSANWDAACICSLLPQIPAELADCNSQAIVWRGRAACLLLILSKGSYILLCTYQSNCFEVCREINTPSLGLVFTACLSMAPIYVLIMMIYSEVWSPSSVLRLYLVISLNMAGCYVLYFMLSRTACGFVWLIGTNHTSVSLKSSILFIGWFMIGEDLC